MTMRGNEIINLAFFEFTTALAQQHERSDLGAARTPFMDERQQRATRRRERITDEPGRQIDRDIPRFLYRERQASHAVGLGVELEQGP